MIRVRLASRPDAGPPPEVDVLIAGAGPAGAASAFHLARAGKTVLVLDRHHFPRDKVCGDFVSPVALREARAMGIEASTRHPPYDGRPGRRGRAQVVRHAAVHLDGRQLIRHRFPRVDDLPENGRSCPGSSSTDGS